MAVLFVGLVSWKPCDAPPPQITTNACLPLLHPNTCLPPHLCALR